MVPKKHLSNFLKTKKNFSKNIQYLLLFLKFVINFFLKHAKDFNLQYVRKEKEQFRQLMEILNPAMKNTNARKAQKKTAKKQGKFSGKKDSRIGVLPDEYDLPDIHMNENISTNSKFYLFFYF